MNKSTSSEKRMKRSTQSESEIPHEGNVTKMVEKQTAKIPSIVYLGLAAGSIALSAGLAMSKKRKGWANFVGLWVPSFLLLGVYNKIVKTEGSDIEDRNQTIH
jgi:hypothetical protein